MISLPNRLAGDPSAHPRIRVSAMTSDRWTASDRPTGTMAPLMEAFLQHSCDLLHDASVSDPRRRAALQSLEGQGFPLAGLARLPLGLFLHAQAMKPALLAAGGTMAALNASRLLADPRLPGRLVSPIRDLDGAIVSFWARHPRGEAPLYLYLNRRWRDYVPAVGLDVALAAGGYDELVLVADPLDMLLFHAHGLMNVAALGAPLGELTGKRWQSLFDLGIRRITLVVDPPEFDAHTLTALKCAARVGHLDRVSVISSRRVRAWLAGDRSGLTADPDLLLARICRERTAASRYRLQSLQLPVLYVNLEAPPPSPPVAPPVATAIVPPPPPPIAPPVAAPPPVVELPVRRPVLRNGSQRCELHRCGETDCFCFD